jgi:hypothetical protein
MTGRVLGDADEPQGGGAVVAVHFGDYRRQEIWVSSGANVGNWYCLGGEFGTPKVWDAPPAYGGGPQHRTPPRPAGTVPQHPDWYDVLERGPVTLLTPGDADTYTAGWKAGRRALWQDMEDAIGDDPPGGS